MRVLVGGLFALHLFILASFPGTPFGSGNNASSSSSSTTSLPGVKADGGTVIITVPFVVDAGVTVYGDVSGSGGAIFTGAPVAATSGAVQLGTTGGVSAVWFTQGTANASTYSLGGAGDTLLNAQSGSGISFRNNNSTVVGRADASGIAIGNAGTAISKSIRGTATLDFASAAAGACSADLSVTVTGATAGTEVHLGVPNASVPAGSQFFAWVSATNTVTVRHCCFTGTCDPASGTFAARVYNP